MVGAFIGCGQHPILRNEHNGRDKNRLHAGDHRQGDEGLVPRTTQRMAPKKINRRTLRRGLSIGAGAKLV